MTASAYDDDAALLDADLLVGAMRQAADRRLAAVRAVLPAIPERDAERRRWALGLDQEQQHALAELEELIRIRTQTAAAWTEDRWADVAALARRHRRWLPLGEGELAALQRLEAHADAHPGRGRRPHPRSTDTMPPVRAGHQVPWGVDPDLPLPTSSPTGLHRHVWQILRTRFPLASSAACTVATHEILRCALEPTLGARDAAELRRAVSLAVTAGLRAPLDPHDHQWVVESIVGRVLVDMVSERDLLAGAVADARALHDGAADRCPTCKVPSPCPTARALGGTSEGVGPGPC